MKYKVTVKGKRWRRIKPMPNPEKWNAPENWESVDDIEVEKIG